MIIEPSPPCERGSQHLGLHWPDTDSLTPSDDNSSLTSSVRDESSSLLSVDDEGNGYILVVPSEDRLSTLELHQGNHLSSEIDPASFVDHASRNPSTSSTITEVEVLPSEPFDHLNNCDVTKTSLLLSEGAQRRRHPRSVSLSVDPREYPDESERVHLPTLMPSVLLSGLRESEPLSLPVNDEVLVDRYIGPRSRMNSLPSRRTSLSSFTSDSNNRDDDAGSQSGCSRSLSEDAYSLRGDASNENMPRWYTSFINSLPLNIPGYFEQNFEDEGDDADDERFVREQNSDDENYLLIEHADCEDRIFCPEESDGFQRNPSVPLHPSSAEREELTPTLSSKHNPSGVTSPPSLLTPPSSPAFPQNNLPLWYQDFLNSDIDFFPLLPAPSLHALDDDDDDDDDTDNGDMEALETKVLQNDSEPFSNALEGSHPVLVSNLASLPEPSMPSSLPSFPLWYQDFLNCDDFDSFLVPRSPSSGGPDDSDEDLSTSVPELDDNIDDDALDSLNLELLFSERICGGSPDGADSNSRPVRSMLGRSRALTSMLRMPRPHARLRALKGRISSLRYPLARHPAHHHHALPLERTPSLVSLQNRVSRWNLDFLYRLNDEYASPLVVPVPVPAPARSSELPSWYMLYLNEGPFSDVLPRHSDDDVLFE